MSRADDTRKSTAAWSTPEKIAACKHEGMYWYSSPHNERGWCCVDCGWSPGEEPGYSPEHDRDLIRTKAWCILHDLVDADIVSISNSDHGESVASMAARKARDERCFDQESVARIILTIVAGDGAFWRERHEQILAGKDPRDRCHCGKLSNSTTWDSTGKRITRCREHWSIT